MWSQVCPTLCSTIATIIWPVVKKRDKKLHQWLPYIVAIVSTAIAIVLALTLMIYDYSCNTCEEKLKNCQESCLNENGMNTTDRNGIGSTIIIIGIIVLCVIFLNLCDDNGRNNNEVVLHGQQHFREITLTRRHRQNH